jgi:hypothetical protein
MTHTPGPWQWISGTQVRHGTPESWPFLTLCGPEPGGNPLTRGDRPVAETMSNARILAAAPELLSELRRLYEAANCMADPEHCLHATRDHLPWKDLAEKARVAIAHAEGSDAPR